MRVVVLFALLLVSGLAQASKKSCDELKAEVAAKLDSKGVKAYVLEVVANDQVGDAKVVGSCAGGTKKLTYMRGKPKA